MVAAGICALCTGKGAQKDGCGAILRRGALGSGPAFLTTDLLYSVWVLGGLVRGYLYVRARTYVCEWVMMGHDMYWCVCGDWR